MPDPLPLDYARPIGHSQGEAPQFEYFAAREYRRWDDDRLFRVYLESDRAYFIKIGGPRQPDVAGGALGVLLGLLVFFGERHSAKKRLDQIHTAPPEKLLADSNCNFWVTYKDMKSPTVLAHKWYQSGPGRFTYVDYKSATRTYLFDDAENMKRAIELLSKKLGAAFSTNARWNESKGKFVRKD